MTGPRRRGWVTGVVATVLLGLLLGGLTACGQDDGAPGASRVDVDTVELREAKAAAGIEDCAPGPGGGSLPDVTLPCLGGGPSVDLADLRGPLVVNLWGSACGPCREEMPALQAFYDEHGEDVGVLGIDVEDRYPGAALTLARESGVTYPLLADPGGDLFDQQQLRLAPGLPQFVLLDAAGDVVHQSAGGLSTVGEVEAMVERHLGGV